MDWYLKAFDAVEVDGYIWFSSKEYNGLFRVDKDTMEGVCMGHFPAEDLYIREAHLKCFYYKNLLIFIPLMAHHIHIYNMSTEEFQLIPIDRQKENEWIIRDSVLKDNQVWIFPNCTNQDMLRLDLDTLGLSVINVFKKQCEEYLGGDDNQYITICCVSKGKAWMAFYDTNIIICWDMDKKKLNFVETDVEHISSVFVDDEDIWIMNTVSTEIYLYRTGEGISEKYLSEASYTCNPDGLHRPYFQMLRFNGELCVVPAFANDFIKFSDGKFISIFHLEDKICNSLFFYGYFCVDDELWVLPNYLSEVYIFDKKFNFKNCKPFVNMDVKSRKIILSRIAKKRLGNFVKNGITVETNYCRLNDFILSCIDTEKFDAK